MNKYKKIKSRGIKSYSAIRVEKLFQATMGKQGSDNGIVGVCVLDI